MSNTRIKEIATKEQKDAIKEMLKTVDRKEIKKVRDMLELTQKGTVKATVDNYMLVLRYDPYIRESLSYNMLTGRIDIVKTLWWNDEICKLDDDARTYYYYFFERYYSLCSESILISCGARLAPFDIAELREIMSYDEMELDKIGDRKTALFLIMSDTDTTFNFVIAMLQSQLFNLLCDKADDVYGGRLPVHVRVIADEFANSVTRSTPKTVGITDKSVA